MIYTLVTRSGQTISLDSITSVSESYTAKATSHPVEFGSPITDHIVLDNNKFSISGVVSDYNFTNPNTGNTATTVSFDTESGSFIGGSGGAESAAERIKKILRDTLVNREFVAFTRTDKTGNSLEEHINCVIIGLSFTDDPDSGEAIYPKIDLEEIRLATLSVEASKTIPKALANPNAAGNVGQDGLPIDPTKDNATKEKTAAEKQHDSFQETKDSLKESIKQANDKTAALQQQLKNITPTPNAPAPPASNPTPPTLSAKSAPSGGFIDDLARWKFY